MDLDGIREKACSFYGYGRWEAPYWFIGPEEGGDHPAERVEVWRLLGAQKLCDCREFHLCIGEKVPEYKKWYRKNPRPAPPLQFTWRKLMLLMKAFRGEPYDNDSLRDYQYSWWGRKQGKTCVIELSGLPAPDGKKAEQLKLQLFSPKEFEEIRQRRIDFICQEMLKQERELVVIYGKEQWKHWKGKGIVDSSLCQEIIEGFAAGFLKFGVIKIALAQHPNFARRDAYWTELGKRLRSY
jgi:hypothetical protein